MPSEPRPSGGLLSLICQLFLKMICFVFVNSSVPHKDRIINNIKPWHGKHRTNGIRTGYLIALTNTSTALVRIYEIVPCIVNVSTLATEIAAMYACLYSHYRLRVSECKQLTIYIHIYSREFLARIQSVV